MSVPGEWMFMARQAGGNAVNARRRGATLTKESIVDAAVELIERRGADVLSMRRLGEELGVDATAFYRHFRDKDELVLAMLDRVIGLHLDYVTGLDDSLGWRDKLRLLAERSWETAGRYPALYSIAFARTTGGPCERAIVEFLLATLSATGLPPDQVVLHYRAFVDADLSMCGMKGTMASLSAEIREKDASAWTRIYATLPLADYPAARSHAAELAGISEDAIHDTVIGAVLDRIALAIERLDARPPT